MFLLQLRRLRRTPWRLTLLNLLRRSLRRPPPKLRLLLSRTAWHRLRPKLRARSQRNAWLHLRQLLPRASWQHASTLVLLAFSLVVRPQQALRLAVLDLRVPSASQPQRDLLHLLQASRPPMGLLWLMFARGERRDPRSAELVPPLQTSQSLRKPRHLSKPTRLSRRQMPLPLPQSSLLHRRLHRSHPRARTPQRVSAVLCRAPSPLRP